MPSTLLLLPCPTAAPASLNMHVASANFAKTLVWNRECEVILLRHKQRKSSNKTTMRHCSILELRRGASNQAVAPGITRPLHTTDPNNKQKPEITNENTGTITCQSGQPVWVWKVLRNLCRDFHLHFQVLWLKPLFFNVAAGLRLKNSGFNYSNWKQALLKKKRFSHGVLANTSRFLRFFSLETLPFLASDG